MTIIEIILTILSFVLLIIISFFIGVPASFDYRMEPETRMLYNSLVIAALILVFVGCGTRKKSMAKS